ncbi:uncharacterized protein LOC120320072 [Crotalus tigris]|uniref:uncharacterized protein LOC120320072 n=1 Tax=Crotalus tigris TaxID=88082 RepID=UPI00192FADB1|nr:uncharacterized protein LOC120320072 [Crotalus tigris]
MLFSVTFQELKANADVEALYIIGKKIEPQTGVHLPEISPAHISNRTFMGLQSEENGSRVEKNIQDENRERQKTRRERQGLDLFKEEFNELKAGPSFFSVNHVMPQVNNHVMPQGNKEDKEAKEENLHQGYPSTDPLVSPRIPFSARQHGELTHFLGDYEPSFTKFQNERPKNNPSPPVEENRPKIPPEKKKLLLEKLFGPNRILNNK